MHAGVVIGLRTEENSYDLHGERDSTIVLPPAARLSLLDYRAEIEEAPADIENKHAAPQLTLYVCGKRPPFSESSHPSCTAEQDRPLSTDV